MPTPCKVTYGTPESVNTVQNAIEGRCNGNNGADLVPFVMFALGREGDTPSKGARTLARNLERAKGRGAVVVKTTAGYRVYHTAMLDYARFDAVQEETELWR